MMGTKEENLRIVEERGLERWSPPSSKWSWHEYRFYLLGGGEFDHVGDRKSSGRYYDSWWRKGNIFSAAQSLPRRMNWELYILCFIVADKWCSAILGRDEEVVFERCGWVLRGFTPVLTGDHERWNDIKKAEKHQKLVQRFHATLEPGSEGCVRSSSVLIAAEKAEKMWRRATRILFLLNMSWRNRKLLENPFWNL